MNKNLILTFFISLLSIAAFAQNNTDKITAALSDFMQTEFMRQYADLRIKAETEMSSFMANAANYAPEDVTRVQVAYDRTAQRFNGLLDKIKTDFMDARKLKYITRYPESYSRGMELDIRELSDFYSQNLQQTLADVTNNQQDGSALLLLLVDLVKMSSGAIQHLTRIRQESRRYTDSYLNQHLVQPNRFKTYQELNGDDNFNNQYSDPYQQNQNTDPYTDPYQQNQNTDPYNTDPYQQQNQTVDPYNTDPYQQQNQNTNPYNTDPYQQNQNTDPYGYDGQARDSLGNPIKVDSTKLAKDAIYFQPKKNGKDSTKVKTAPKQQSQKKTTENKKTTKKNN